MKKAPFIVIDGTDATGKKTQTELLRARCEKEGIMVKKTDFPRYNDNFFGKLIRECLDGKHGDFIAIPPKIASVLYAGDRFESSKEIRSWLEDGCMVITDRYVSANQIHQGGKIADKQEREDFIDWLDEMEYGVFGIPKPDLVLYLDLPTYITLALIKERESNGQNADVAESNEKHLIESRDRALDTISKFGNCVRIDCSQNGEIKTREEIHELIFAKVRELLSSI